MVLLDHGHHLRMVPWWFNFLPPNHRDFRVSGWYFSKAGFTGADYPPLALDLFLILRMDHRISHYILLGPSGNLRYLMVL